MNIYKITLAITAIITILLFASCSRDVDVIDFNGEIIPVDGFTDHNEVNDFLQAFDDTIYLKDSRLLDFWGSTSCFLTLTHRDKEIGIFSIDYIDGELIVGDFKKYSINNDRIKAKINNWYSIDDTILRKGVMSVDVEITNAKNGESSSSDEFFDLIKTLSQEKQTQ